MPGIPERSFSGMNRIWRHGHDLQRARTETNHAMQVEQDRHYWMKIWVSGRWIDFNGDHTQTKICTKCAKRTFGVNGYGECNTCSPYVEKK